MTIAWRNKPDEPEALPKAVTGPAGTIFHDCDTVAGVDKNIRMVQFQLVAHKAFPKRITAHWQDLDALLDRRRILQLETWLNVSDLPL